MRRFLLTFLRLLAYDQPVDGCVRVLLVEDEPDIAELYRVELQRAGCVVTVAQDGETGCELAAGLQPDIILLDFRMPKLNGLEVLAKLRADEGTRDIPVLMLSNDRSPIVIEKSRELGALEFLSKADTTRAQLSESVRTHARPGNTRHTSLATPQSHNGPLPSGTLRGASS